MQANFLNIPSYSKYVYRIFTYLLSINKETQTIRIKVNEKKFIRKMSKLTDNSTTNQTVILVVGAM